MYSSRTISCPPYGSNAEFEKVKPTIAVDSHFEHFSLTVTVQTLFLKTKFLTVTVQTLFLKTKFLTVTVQTLFSKCHHKLLTVVDIVNTSDF
jgi:hypothetical protein